MRDLRGLAIRHLGGRLELLDQGRLPQREEWVGVDSPWEMISYIQELKVRGGPLIGVASALCLGKYAESGASQGELMEAALALRAARPTAVNLMGAVDAILGLIERQGAVGEIVGAAEHIFAEDVELCQRIGHHGAGLIDQGDQVLTHCNTGGLATAGQGTALGVIRVAWEQGKKIHVWVDETRPLLQGGRLTTWECERLKIPYTLICDSMAAFLMAEKKVSKVIVGADRIACNGDFANKIGTYSLAVNAHFHRIPFYVAAPCTTVDRGCESGGDILIEQRDASEVRGVKGAFGQVQWAMGNGSVYNPAFDITPAGLVTAWILDKKNLFLSNVKDGELYQLGR